MRTLMRFGRWLAWLFAGVLFASAFTAGAFAVSKAEDIADDPVQIAVSAPVEVALLDEDAVYAFQPTANSVYGIYLFAPEDSAAWLSARLFTEGGREVAVGSASEGAPCAITARLTSGERYRLVISGVGKATLEIARKTLGRCFDDPIRLDANGSYAKLIAQAGDSHWYAFQPEDSVPATIGIFPDVDGKLHLKAALLNASGKLVSQAVPMFEGACAAYGMLVEGETYYLRVEAEDGETGGYRLQVLFDDRDAAAPKSLTLTETDLTISVGGRRRLTAQLLPENAVRTVFWRSSDPERVIVTGDGEVIAVAAGEATVAAYGFGGVVASCAVTAEGVPMTGIHFDSREWNLRVGESENLLYSFEPAGAYTRDVHFTVDDESIAHVEADGSLLALAEGTTVVRVSAGGGRFTSEATVYVEPAAPRFRALLVAEQLYRQGVNKPRTGAINTVENLNGMLATFDLEGAPCEATMLLDATRGELTDTLRRVFADAEPQDVSLLYITCHGYYQAGMSYLQFCDGSLMSAVDLEQCLRRIPGTVVVLIDCCGSGGFLGRASSSADFNRGVIAPFRGYNGDAVLTGSKYKVLASALLDEDSYRISFDEDMSESAMMTIFARALTDGAGWNTSRSRRAAMRADLDMDRAVTLQELYQYAARRVTWYLQLVGGDYRQNVQVWPAGDPFIVFSRSAN